MVPVMRQALCSLHKQPSKVTLLARVVDVGHEAQRGFLTWVRLLSWKKKELGFDLRLDQPEISCLKKKELYQALFCSLPETMLDMVL